jgi:hypothetical protein
MAMEEEIQWAIDHDGDVSEFPLAEALNKIKIDRKVKIVNTALWIKSLEANADAIGAETEALGKREKSLRSKVEKLKVYLQNSMDPGEKISDPRVDVAIVKKRESVALMVKPTELPPKYLKKPKPEESKEALAADMQEVDELVVDEIGNPVFEEAPIEEQLEGHAPLVRKQLTRKAKVVTGEFDVPVIDYLGSEVVDPETGNTVTQKVVKILARMVGGFTLKIK